MRDPRVRGIEWRGPGLFWRGGGGWGGGFPGAVVWSVAVTCGVGVVMAGAVLARSGMFLRILLDRVASGTQRAPLRSWATAVDDRGGYVRDERAHARVHARRAAQPPAAPQALHGR